MKHLFLITALARGLVRETHAQSADWQSVVWREPQVRYLLADLTLNGGKTDLYRKYAKEERDPDSIEAIRLWDAGARVVNTNDLAYPEVNVRYFMADIALGGSIEFYRAAAERDHEMGCLEAVRRTEEGFKITNLDQFERKKFDGKTLITRKGSNERISGMLVKLSTDIP